VKDMLGHGRVSDETRSREVRASRPEKCVNSY
jgi:hypothetical protein